MNWLFLNVKLEHQPEDVRNLIDDFSIVEQTLSTGDQLSLVYDERLSQAPPIAENDNMRLFIVGWLVLDGQLNPFEQLLRSIQEQGLTAALQAIHQGVFVGILDDGQQLYCFTDWFGLGAHFIASTDKQLRIAPSASALKSAINPIDEVHASIIAKKGHIWGHRTRYTGVERMLPGHIYRLGEKACYIDFRSVESIAPAAIPNKIAETTRLFARSQKLVAISAGFDSRLLALVGDASKGYTWGPETSKDSVNSKIVAQAMAIDTYYFRFKETAPTAAHRSICQWLLDGQNQEKQAQFLVNYGKAAKRAKPAFVALDGYLGDVLQRGVYLYGSSIRSEVKRLLPTLFKKDTSLRILHERYSVLNTKELELLENDFESLMSLLKLDAIDEGMRVNAFEFVYGRGFAHIYMGGIALNGVYNLVVPGFAQKTIFSSCIRSPVGSVLDYTLFKSIWRELDNSIVELRSEGLYSPRTHKHLIPFANFVGRLTTNLLPQFKNYGKE